MALEYGQKGLCGVLTPQANTTVEAELWALLSPGHSLINARLVSAQNTIEKRLIDYTSRFAETIELQMLRSTVSQRLARVHLI